MKRLVALLLIALALVGCSPKAPEQKQYTATFLELFDTVTTIMGRAESEEAFREKAQAIHDELLYYHQLFDIYNSYDGLNNLKTVNDQAGIAPVQVDEAIIALLQDCKAFYDLTEGRVNVAMGSVLLQWHEARQDSVNDPANAYLPGRADLEAAAAHTAMEDLIIDEAASTVFLADPQMRLNVGAVAKGWAAQRVCEDAPEGLLLSVGGNICATGPKTPEGNPWVIGIQDPADAEKYLHTLYVSGGSVVTSGDYQRAFTVDGQLYHHIIDPDTLQPGKLWRAVTVVCADSGLADALSTVLFLLPLEAGKQLLEKADAEALWVDAEGKISYSSGFEAMIRS